MSNRTTRILILTVLLTAVTAGLAHSASFTYASHRKEIKAGVLILPDAGGAYTERSAAPYLFYVLNQRTDVKPQGWDFTNPLAISRVTVDARARWNTALGPAYNVGDPVTKEMGCYWEVKIDAGLAELSQFDILYVGLTGICDLNRTQREKLRKLVDAGGVLWIEYCSGGLAGTANFFASDVQFASGGGPAWAGAPNRLHPLVHRPYDLAWDELSRLGTDANELSGSGMHRVGGRMVSFSPGGDKYFATVIGIGGGAGNPILAGSQYGSGHIVASSESIGYAVSAFGSTYVLGNNMIRNGTYCPADRASLAPTEDVKAAINIACWGSEHTTFHKNARHTGYSYDEVGAPLALKWNFDFALKEPGAGVPTGSSPAFLNDTVFYVDGGGMLRAFDISPSQDLDNDGNTDDGVPDYALGVSYDQIWFANCGEPASSPTVALVPVGGGAAVPAVFVATLSGKILGLNASTGAALVGGNPVIMQVNPYQVVAGSPIVPAPTYFEGSVYAGDGLGYLQATNLQDNTQWHWPRVHSPLPPTMNSPTVGYFRNPITGSVDQLVYMAALGKPASANGCVYSFPIKIYNEVLSQAPGMPTQFRVRKYQTMAIKNDPATFQLYYSLPGGGLVDILDTAVTVILPGTFNITSPIPSGASVIADYEIDTANTVYPPQYRQRIDVKNRLVTAGNPDGFGVLSTPSASSNDTLYYAAENGSFYAVMEDGWGITTKWRWYLNDPGPVAILGSGANPVGSPAVGGDRVYYAVNGTSGAAILAFEADPVFRISVGGAIDSRRPVEVLQYDNMNPGREPVAVSGAAEGTDTSRRRVAFKVDYDKGRITVENFLDPLSASQSLIVRYFPPSNTPGPGSRVEQIHSAFPGPGDVVYDDYWNNMAWCLKLPNTRISSSPMLMGSLLYFGDDGGRVHAVNVQRVAQTTDKGAVLSVNDDIHSVWPDLTQPPLGGAILSTVGGSMGNIAVSSPEGLAVLYNALTLVADSHRVLEIDASGQVVWSCDSTSNYTGTRVSKTDTPAYAAAKTAFNRPAVARRIGTSNILVADTGNNRVVLIDRAGNALCEINEFRDPLNVLPIAKIRPANPNIPGDTPVSVHSLNSPTDAWVWTGPGLDPGTLTYHFLIADSGNHRVVEVEAVFDPNTGRYSTVNLLWATHTLEQGKRYRYISARRYPKLGGGTETICVVDNLVPESSTLETTGGAIVTIDDATGLIATDGVRRYVDKTDGSRGIYKLVNPTFFSREFKAGGLFTDIIGDAQGLFAADFNAGTPTAQAVRVYRASQHVSAPVPPAVTGAQRPLTVSHAQLLPSGNVLVTNKASTLNAGPSYAAQGEVFELSSDFTTIIWPRTGVDVGRGSYPLEQPSSAERLYQ